MCLVEPRRSSRREGQPAVSYSENMLDLVDAPVRRRGGKGRVVIGELRRECCSPCLSAYKQPGQARLAV